MINRILSKRIARLLAYQRSLLRPTKGSSAPIQKEGTGPKSLPPEKKHGPNPKGVAGSKFANGEERGPNPKGVAGSHKVMEVEGGGVW